MINIYRMVSRLSQLMKNAHTTTTLSRSSKYCIPEILLIDNLRTRESKQNTSRTNLFESFRIQFRISSQSITQGITMLSESRRIQNNQVILITHTVQILKRIFRISFMASIPREIQLYILVCQVNSLC